MEVRINLSNIKGGIEDAETNIKSLETDIDKVYENVKEVNSSECWVGSCAKNYAVGSLKQKDQYDTYVEGLRKISTAVGNMVEDTTNFIRANAKVDFAGYPNIVMNSSVYSNHVKPKINATISKLNSTSSIVSSTRIPSDFVYRDYLRQMSQRLSSDISELSKLDEWYDKNFDGVNRLIDALKDEIAAVEDSNIKARIKLGD